MSAPIVMDHNVTRTFDPATEKAFLFRGWSGARIRF
jgi:hypothetical protein